ncbi:hypothetical protein [Thauera humireducens]|uniref:hypothetical protein n=1 Tax=Thauera humireducens TaxID=1134435 RepID=UPI00311F40A7
MDFSLPALLFWLKKLLAALVLPPLLPLLPVIAGLLLLRRRPRLGRVLAWGGVALNLLLTLPASVGWLAKQLEDPRPLSLEASRGAQAIVVLGAGRRDYAPEYGGETLTGSRSSGCATAPGSRARRVCRCSSAAAASGTRPPRPS